MLYGLTAPSSTRCTTLFVLVERVRPRKDCQALSGTSRVPGMVRIPVPTNCWKKQNEGWPAGPMAAPHAELGEIGVIRGSAETNRLVICWSLPRTFARNAFAENNG